MMTKDIFDNIWFLDYVFRSFVIIDYVSIVNGLSYNLDKNIPVMFDSVSNRLPL